MAERGNRINLKDIDISLETSIRGGSGIKGRITGAETATVTISADDSVAYEGGSYLPVEILDGKVSISGTLEKAWLSNDFFKALFPQQNNNSGLVTVIKPTFTLKATVNNSKAPKRKIEIYGVKFNSVGTGNVSLENYATQSMPFNATGYQFLD